MSSTTLASPASVLSRPSFRANWIISRRDDLTWFIGSALAGYLAVGLMYAGFPVLPIQFVWFFALDNPHVLATATRTYFDKEERRKLGWFLWIPVPLFLIGPAMALAGKAAIFFLFAFCWQQFHVTKQHFGFMMLYKAKNRERDDTDRRLDRWFLLLSLFVPLALFIVRTEPWARALPGMSGIRGAALLSYGVLCAVWLLRQAQKLLSGAEMNWPKLALLAGVVPLQWLALGFGARYGPAGVLQAAIPLGIFHGLQYHRLLWFHNHNRYSAPDARERNGLAAVLATNVSRYLAVALGLNVVLAFLPQALFPYQTMQAAIWGFAFTHYCLDAKIWRVRSDKGLAVALRMAPSAGRT
jgi:hypothetical protein